LTRNETPANTEFVHSDENRMIITETIRNFRQIFGTRLGLDMSFNLVSIDL
jgi:hypothetical protein